MITDFLIKNKWKLGTAKNMQQIFCNTQAWNEEKNFQNEISNTNKFFNPLIKKLLTFEFCKCK
jgi:hypothetical protein